MYKASSTNKRCALWLKINFSVDAEEVLSSLVSKAQFLFARVEAIRGNFFELTAADPDFRESIVCLVSHESRIGAVVFRSNTKKCPVGDLGRPQLLDLQSTAPFFEYTKRSSVHTVDAHVYPCGLSFGMLRRVMSFTNSIGFACIRSVFVSRSCG